MAAVYGAVFFLLRFLIKQVRFRLLGSVSGGPRPSKLAATSALAVVMGYACLVTLDGFVDLVDPNFPAIRSSIMITTFVFAYLIDRDGDPFNITLLAALLILGLDPYALFGIGFQLSFVGVLAIFYAYRFLSPLRTDATEQRRPPLCDPLKPGYGTWWSFPPSLALGPRLSSCIISNGFPSSPPWPTSSSHP